MDFLDSIELDSTHNNRSCQVRSWYLYEQYKSLERNQVEATKKLYDRSHRDRLLHQALSEHRRRRKMCSARHSEPTIDYFRDRDMHSCVSSSITELFESFCEVDEDEFVPCNETDDTSNIGDHSQILTERVKPADDNDEPKECNVLKGKHLVPRLIFEDRSLLQFSSSKSNLADDIKEELEYVKRNIIENIHHQLEMKDNMQSLEDYTKLEDSRSERNSSTRLDDKESSKYDDYIDGSDDDIASLCSMRRYSPLGTNESNPLNMYALWAKIVSFAYQIIQLNHGNVLQPYVSPINYASDRPISSHKPNRKKEKTNKTVFPLVTKKSKKKYRNKLQRKNRHVRCGVLKLRATPSTSSAGDKIHTLESQRRRSCNTKTKTPLQTWPSTSAYPSMSLPSDRYSSSIWPEELNTRMSVFSSCCTRVTNPMLKLASYIDSIIDIGHS